MSRINIFLGKTHNVLLLLEMVVKMLWRGAECMIFVLGKCECCNLSLFFPLFITMTSHFFLASCSTKTTIQWCACMHFVLYFHTTVLWFALQCKRVGCWCYKCLQPHQLFCMSLWITQKFSWTQLRKMCIKVIVEENVTGFHVLMKHLRHTVNLQIS